MSENITVDKLADDSYDIDVTIDHIDISITDKIGTFLHPGLTQLNWADAGHTIDTDIDMEDNALVNTDHIDFNLVSSVLQQEGRLSWNSDDGTLNLGMPGGNVNLQIGQENLIRATNDEGSQINNGQAVYVSGATGSNPQVKLADKDSLTTASVIGVATENITDSQKGYITTFGYVREMDTSGILEGDIAWLGDDGNLVAIRPTSPDIQVGVGIVMREHATEGVLFVNPYITPRLQGLSDVFISPLEGDLLKYNGSTLRFEAYNLGITKEPTGFAEPEDVIITGDDSTRTITLTGTVNGYYHGVINTTIINGWTSPAHGADINELYLLIYDGLTVEWHPISSISEDFIYLNLFIALAFYDSVNTTWVYGRECHGLMQWQSHRENHRLLGTYRESGGGLDDFIESSTTATDRRPSVEATEIFDEDLQTINPSLAEGDYTQISLTGVGIVEFNRNELDIVPLLVNNPYWNEFDGANWVQTLMTNNYYTSIWVGCIPVASDSNSQELRYVWIQGQNETATLTGQQVLDARDVNLGNLQNLTPEFVFTNQVILKFIGGNWSIEEVRVLTGSRASQTSSPTGNFLTSVTSDATLSGLGTASSPLSVEMDVLTTKGDLLTYDTGNARLPVGTDDQVLTADSTQAEGVAWVDGFTRDVLFTGSAGASTINLSGNISDYNLLEFTAQVDGMIYYYTKIVSAEKFTATSASNLDGIYTSRPATERSIVYYSASDTSITITGTGTTKMTLNEVAGIK